MKKILAMLLAVLAVVGLFAGCTPTDGPGNTNIDEAPYEVDENGQFVYGDTFKDVTVDWWFASAYELNSDMYLFKKLEEVVGCKINVTCYDGETYKVKINTALQTNQLPDMCAMIVQYPVYNKYGDQGAFVNLLDPAVMSKLPNMKKAVFDNAEYAAAQEFFKSEKGGIYSFPIFAHNRTVNFGWMYREDIFEKHGIEMWTDNESFLNVLRKLKQLYPESYPLTGASMYSVFNREMNAHGANALTEAYDWEKKEWFLGAATEGYYEMMKVFQTAWNEGLVDPDIFTNKVNHIDEAILAGTSFVYNSWIGRMDTENREGRKTDPNFQVSYAPHIGDGKGDQLSQIGNTGTVVNAQSDALTIDACLAIYNFFYSEEGIKTLTIGEEGKTYDMVDGKRVYKNADGSEMTDPSVQTLEKEHGLWNGSTYVSASKDSVYFKFTPEEAEAQEIGLAKGYIQAKPTAAVAEEFAETYNDLSADLKNEITQYSQKFVLENYSKADWEAKVKEWNTKYAELFDILNGKA